MKYLNCFLLKSILIYFLLISNCKSDDWLEIVKREVELLKTPFPSDGDRLVFRIDSTGDIYTSKFPLEELEDELDEHDFSDELNNKIRTILWTTSMTFQSFSYYQFYGQSVLVETAGVARKIKNDVDLFYFQSRTVATLRPQTTVVQIKKCTNFLGLFDIYCWNEDKRIPRAFYIEEINSIQDALRSKAYESLYDALNNHGKPTLFLTDSEISQPTNESTLDKQIEEAKLEDEERINIILKVYNEDKYIKLLPRNANDFKKAIDENNFYSIAPQSLSKFFEIFVNNISKSMNEKFAIYLKMVLRSLDKHLKSNIASLKFFVTNSDYNLDLYEVFLNFNKKDNQYSIRVRKMKTDIKLDSAVLISKLNSDDVISISHNQEDDLAIHLSPLLNLFEVVCQNI